MTVGQRLKKAREYRQVKPAEIANELGISVTQYEQQENSAIDMTVRDILTIARFLGMSVDDLIGSSTFSTEDKISGYRVNFEEGDRVVYGIAGSKLGTVPLIWGRFRVGSWIQGFEAGRKSNE